MGQMQEIFFFYSAWLLHPDLHQFDLFKPNFSDLSSSSWIFPSTVINLLFNFYFSIECQYLYFYFKCYRGFQICQVTCHRLTSTFHIVNFAFYFLNIVFIFFKVYFMVISVGNVLWAPFLKLKFSSDFLSVAFPYILLRPIYLAG